MHWVSASVVKDLYFGSVKILCLITVQLVHVYAEWRFRYFEGGIVDILLIHVILELDLNLLWNSKFQETLHHKVNF